jgi:hypothetical protein
MRNTWWPLALLPIVLAAAACRSSRSEPPASAVEATALPEIRYYVIGDS